MLAGIHPRGERVIQNLQVGTKQGGFLEPSAKPRSHGQSLQTCARAHSWWQRAPFPEISARAGDISEYENFHEDHVHEYAKMT